MNVSSGPVERIKVERIKLESQSLVLVKSIIEASKLREHIKLTTKCHREHNGRSATLEKAS